MLSEGTVEDLELDGVRAYRLIRNQNQGRPVALYLRGCCEFGCELLIGRPNFVNAARSAKENGYHIVAAGYIGWHPLYGIADEYWGVRNWNSNKQQEGQGAGPMLDKERRLIATIHKPNAENAGFNLLTHPINHPLYDLPLPSKRALEMVENLTNGTPFIAMAPTLRKIGFEARDFHCWDKLYEKLEKFGLPIFATSPRAGSFELPCKFLEDMAGIENAMDLEIAFYSRAIVSLASNTGSAGLMIYSNTPNIVLFGGCGGFPPGWDGLANSLHQLDGYKTKMFQPEPMLGGDDLACEDAVRIVKKILESPK